MTLSEYFKTNLDQGVIDFALRASVRPDGSAEFYIHPQDQNGLTRDYEVNGDTIRFMAEKYPNQQDDDRA